MLKLLLVDDEAIERAGVQFMLKHFGMEFEVLEAENGKQALELLQEHPVHIVMTDIKMPIMDGLTLSTQIRQQGNGVKIVIFSAYGEFEYAKKAMHCDIRDYILKPLNPDEFCAVFTRIIQECQQQAQEEQQQLLEDAFASLLLGDSADPLPTALADMLTGERVISPLLIGTEHSFFDQVSVHELLADLLSMPFLHCSPTPEQCLLLLDTTDARVGIEVLQLLWQRLSGHCSGKVVLALNSPIHQPSQLAEAYRQLEIRLENGLFLDISVQLPTNGRDAQLDDDHVYKVVASICTLNSLEVARAQTYQLLEAFGQQKDYSSIYIKYICGEIVRQMMQKNGRLVSTSQWDIVESMFREGDLVEIQKQMDCFFVELLKNQSGEGVDARKVIRMMQEIVETRYQEDISLFCIAQELYMNATYLSVLFKQQMGISFVKYLTGWRMERAVEMVKNTNIRMSDIGKLVGYPNSSYFGSVFRRIYGTTPAKYREDYEKNA